MMQIEQAVRRCFGGFHCWLLNHFLETRVGNVIVTLRLCRFVLHVMQKHVTLKFMVIPSPR